jgi:hypothetical protein
VLLDPPYWLTIGVDDNWKSDMAFAHRRSYRYAAGHSSIIEPLY